MKKSKVIFFMIVLALSLSSVTLPKATSSEVSAKGTGIYKSCKAFNAKYPKGVRVSAKTMNKVVKRNGKVEYRKSSAFVSASVYKTAVRNNPSLDRDNDNIACEK